MSDFVCSEDKQLIHKLITWGLGALANQESLISSMPLEEPPNHSPNGAACGRLKIATTSG